MLQTPSEIEDAALFLECLSLQDGGYSDAGIVLEDEIGARIGEFERSGVMGAGGLGGRGEFGEGDGIGEFGFLLWKESSVDYEGTSCSDLQDSEADIKRSRRSTLQRSNSSILSTSEFSYSSKLFLYGR